MLELIVLGRIPGTQFEITFWWSLVLFATLFISLEINVRRAYRRKPLQISIQNFSEITI